MTSALLSCTVSHCIHGLHMTVSSQFLLRSNCVCVRACVYLSVSECLFCFDRKTSRTALLFLRSFLSTAFLAPFLSRGSQRVCACVRRVPLRARSVYERAMHIDYRNPAMWQRYAEMEMRNGFLNHARNVWERATTLLPRVDALWLKWVHMEVPRPDAHLPPGRGRSLPTSLTLERGRAVRCARTLRKVGYFVPIVPDGQGDTVTAVFPFTGLLRSLLSPETQMMS